MYILTIWKHIPYVLLLLSVTVTRNTYIFIGTSFGLLWNIYQTEHITTFISAYKIKLYGRFHSKSFDYILLVYVMNMQYLSVFNTMLIMYLLSIYNLLQSIDYGESDYIFIWNVVLTYLQLNTFWPCKPSVGHMYVIWKDYCRKFFLCKRVLSK